MGQEAKRLGREKRATSSVLINPATGEELRTVEQTTAEGVDDAVARAVAAQKDWARVAPADRAGALRSFAAVVDAHVDELAALEIANSGHPIGNAEWEAGHVRDVLQFYSASPERLSGKQIPVAGGLDVTFNEPLGVVGVITPWNFPMTIASWGFAPALAAGNAVLVKPAEWTPLTTIRLGESALEAGLPEGLLQVLPGKGLVIGERFVTHPDVRKIVFTGSTEVGIGVLEQYKRGQMERRIRTFAATRGAGRLAEYLRLLRRDHRELDAFLDRITINVSQLWRNPAEWAALAADVLPALAAGGRIRAWCAGCSYGAEAYTLAAVAAEAVPAARIDVRGTDIDERMVARAREGRFSLADARDVPPAALARWFEADGGELVADPALRRRVRFDTGDLLRMPVRPRSYDLVLCRNTVIYFTPGVRDDLHARLAETLRPGGVLLVGATERVADPAALGLRPLRPHTYRREG